MHVQYFVNFSKPHRLAALKKICSKSHFTPVSRDNGASDYCLKEETRVAGPLELGIKPARKNVAGETAERNKRILELGVEECVAQGLVHMKEYLKLKQCVDAYRLNTAPAQDHDDVRGVWFWGPPGTGKSREARRRYPEAYLKSQNKWWDGYRGQPAVILDDLDTEALGHLLKIWADRYACNGEIKGSTIPLQHKVFCVTSNYHPS